jgi:CRISPR system Cascade subunit CasE
MKMYLSKIEMHGKLVRNPYLIHKVLWGLFDNSPNQKRDYLFRIEKRQFSNAAVLLQSDREPSHRGNDAVALIASKPFSPVLALNMHLRFYAVCNPVKTISDESGRKNAKGEVKKCRVPLITEDAQMTWFTNKLKDSAKIVTIEAQKLPPLFFRKAKAARSGKIQPIAFRGEIKIANPDELFSILHLGIGPAKAFGCGLISLARA